MEFDINAKATDENLQLFADELMEINRRVGFRISARGWCYQMETERLIDKDSFDRVEGLINKCRKKGILPVDFVAEDQTRIFSGVEIEERDTPLEFLRSYVEAPLSCHEWYTPDWWKNEEYYIQILVEKIDLKTLFEPICEEYHIPIATSKGWSSIIQRAEYTRRFKEAEERGLKCLLLYCGDHDPDGLRISDALMKNLMDLRRVVWSDGTDGYDPRDLHIERFGLNADFIDEHGLTWIDNLITGGKNVLAIVEDGVIKPGIIKEGKNAGNPHQNYFMPYMQDYLNRFGVKKCEANAIVPIPDIARSYIREVIEGWLGEDALGRFEDLRQDVQDQMDEVRNAASLNAAITASLKMIDGLNDDDE